MNKCLYKWYIFCYKNAYSAYIYRYIYIKISLLFTGFIIIEEKRQTLRLDILLTVFMEIFADSNYFGQYLQLCAQFKQKMVKKIASKVFFFFIVWSGDSLRNTLKCGHGHPPQKYI